MAGDFLGRVEVVSFYMSRQKIGRAHGFERDKFIPNGIPRMAVQASSAQLSPTA